MQDAGKTSGFRTPHRHDETIVHAKAIEYLYRFYAHANEELYRLADSLGPASGWSGTFPASFREMEERDKRRMDEGTWHGGM